MLPEHNGYCSYPRIEADATVLIPTPLGGVSLTTVARWFYTTEYYVTKRLGLGDTVSDMFLDLADAMDIPVDQLITNMVEPATDQLPWQQALIWLYIWECPVADKAAGMRALIRSRRNPTLKWLPRFKTVQWPVRMLPSTTF